MSDVRNKEVDIIVTKANNPKGVDFILDPRKGKPKSNRVKFNNKGHPGILVYFNIEDDDNTGLVFKPNPGDALWVDGTGPNCPPPDGSTWDQFIPLSVEKDGKQLIVYNRNLNEQEFAFMFWFLWPDGTEVDYDPIGDNANGIRR